MQHADELLIRIDSKGNIYVEDTEDGIKSYKRIQPDTFIHCVKNSISIKKSFCKFSYLQFRKKGLSNRLRDCKQ